MSALFPGHSRTKAKPVRCVETREVFPSVAAAAKWAGSDRSAISHAIRLGHRAGGYHWEYADIDASGVESESEAMQEQALEPQGDEAGSSV